MRLIDADALKMAMFHEAFETDTPLQKWDSGCWIRYKLFEKVINNVPDAIITCEQCEHWDTDWESYKGQHFCIMVEHNTPGDFFCADGERKEEI